MPDIGQSVRGCTMLGTNFAGTIVAVREPIRGNPAVDVQVKEDVMPCAWFDDDPRKSETPEPLWQSCWPAEVPRA